MRLFDWYYQIHATIQTARLKFDRQGSKYNSCDFMKLFKLEGRNGKILYSRYSVAGRHHVITYKCIQCCYETVYCNLWSWTFILNVHQYIPNFIQSVRICIVIVFVTMSLITYSYQNNKKIELNNISHSLLNFFWNGCVLY